MIVELHASIRNLNGAVVATRVLELALNAVPRVGELVVAATGDEFDVVRVTHYLEGTGPRIVVELEVFSDVADALASDLESLRWRDPSSS